MTEVKKGLYNSAKFKGQGRDVGPFHFTLIILGFSVFNTRQ